MGKSARRVESKYFFSVSVLVCMLPYSHFFHPFQIFLPARLANFTKFYTLLVFLALLFHEICLECPPYSFIWPYLFNWHLRVVRQARRHNFYPWMIPFLPLHFRTQKILSIASWVLTKSYRYMFSLRLICDKNNLQLMQGTNEIGDHFSTSPRQFCNRYIS